MLGTRRTPTRCRCAPDCRETRRVRVVRSWSAGARAVALVILVGCASSVGPAMAQEDPGGRAAHRPYYRAACALFGEPVQ